MSKKKMSPSAKTVTLQISSVLVTITPLLTAIGINFKDYFYQASGVQVGFGGMLAMLLVVLLAKDKATMFKGVWGYLVVFLLAVFLKPILDDVILLTGMALAGKSADSILISRPLARAKAASQNGTDKDNMVDGFMQAFSAHVKSLGGGNG